MTTRMEKRQHNVERQLEAVRHLAELRQAGQPRELARLVNDGVSIYRKVTSGKHLPPGVEQFTLTPEEMQAVEAYRREKEQTATVADHARRWQRLAICPFCKQFEVTLDSDNSKVCFVLDYGMDAPCPHLLYLSVYGSSVEIGALPRGELCDSLGGESLRWKHLLLDVCERDAERKLLDLEPFARELEYDPTLAPGLAIVPFSSEQQAGDGQGETYLLKYVTGWAAFAKNAEEFLAWSGILTASAAEEA